MKTTVDSLGVFGGPSIFEQPLHVGRPNIGDVDRFTQRLQAIFERCWLTNDGPVVREFEHTIAAAHKVNHCVAMSNGTSALEIACRALGISGEVILPSFTFVATAHALKWQGLQPVFCDVAEDSFNIDPARIEALITPATSAIIGVHLWGESCDISGVLEVAKKHNLAVVFDAAHAFGCSYKGRPIGGFGDAEILSFHGTKFVNAFEGGCLLTNNDDLAKQARLMRNFGFSGNDNVVALGTNAKMNEISAAMGLTSLESADDFIAHNRALYDVFRKLNAIRGIDVFEYSETEQRNYQYVVTSVHPEFELTRDQVVRVLEGEGVLARRYFYPGCHRMQPYVAELDNSISERLQNTESICEKVMLLPTGTQLETAGAQKIVDAIQFVQDNVHEVRERLTALEADDGADKQESPE